MKYYVYLLQSLKVSDPEGLSSAPEELKLRRKTRRDNCYIGQTNNVQKRLKEHNMGKVRATRYRIPFKLLGYETYKTRNEARWREYDLKHHSDKKRKFIEKLRRDASSPEG